MESEYHWLQREEVVGGKGRQFFFNEYIPGMYMDMKKDRQPFIPSAIFF